MKKFSVIAFSLLASAAIAQDAVNPNEVKQLMAAHPQWKWLGDPALAKLTLAGPRAPSAKYNVDDIRGRSRARSRPGTPVPPPCPLTPTCCSTARPWTNGPATIWICGPCMMAW